MSEPTDSTGKPIKVGDRVRFRGKVYTIKEFIPGERVCGIVFTVVQHTTEMATEISVDLVEAMSDTHGNEAGRTQNKLYEECGVCQGSGYFEADGKRRPCHCLVLRVVEIGVTGPAVEIARVISCYPCREQNTEGDAMTIGEMKEMEDLKKELEARKQILDQIQAVAGEGSWMGVLDWRKRLHDCGQDAEQHSISRDDWRMNDCDGITLYAHPSGMFVAYYGDAGVIWEQADDTRPMFHCNVNSYPPPRALIHPLHLCGWLEHFAAMCMPVQVIGFEFLEPEEEED